MNIAVVFLRTNRIAHQLEQRSGAAKAGNPRVRRRKDGIWSCDADPCSRQGTRETTGQPQSHGPSPSARAPQGPPRQPRRKGQRGGRPHIIHHHPPTAARRVAAGPRPRAGLPHLLRRRRRTRRAVRVPGRVGARPRRVPRTLGRAPRTVRRRLAPVRRLPDHVRGAASAVSSRGFSTARLRLRADASSRAGVGGRAGRFRRAEPPQVRRSARAPARGGVPAPRARAGAAARTFAARACCGRVAATPRLGTWIVRGDADAAAPSRIVRGGRTLEGRKRR